MTADEVRALLARRFPGGRLEAGPGLRRVTVQVEPGEIAESARALGQQAGLRFVTIAAVDRGLDLELLYQYALHGVIITVRTRVQKEVSRIDSITPAMPAAEFIEQEIAELFGVEFAGHPRRTNLALPDDWPAAKRPLRKPLTGEIIPQARLSVENLLSGGASLKLGPSAGVKREKAGLPKSPPLVSADAERLREFQELMKRTGFAERAGFDWRKGKLRYR